jgi:pheromone shutdown protein TraB
MWLTVNLFAYFQLKEMDDVDMLTLVIQEMSKQFPTLMDTLVHERDQLVVFCLCLFCILILF